MSHDPTLGPDPLVEKPHFIFKIAYRRCLAETIFELFHFTEFSTNYLY